MWKLHENDNVYTDMLINTAVESWRRNTMLITFILYEETIIICKYIYNGMQKLYKNVN